MKASSLFLSVALITVARGPALRAQEEEKPTKSLMTAVGEDDIEQVRRHIARGSNLNQADQSGTYTPLKIAVEGRNLEIVRMLLDAGAKPDVKDRDGMTPLMYACGGGQKEIAEALIAKGAAVNAKDNYDRTALHSAINAAQTEMVELLVKAGADVNATDKQGQMPLSMARLRGQTEVVELLTKQGAKEPVLSDRYGAYGDEMAYLQGASAQAVPTTYREEIPEIEIDPNVIREQMKQFADLAAALQAVEGKSATEVRGWISRRVDNRTTLLRSVQKQFEDEMAFLKPIAVAEKAKETVQEIDDLVARRKTRYDLIGDGLRDQRRDMLAESRATGFGMGGRGRSSLQSGTPAAARGRSARDMTQNGADPYGYPGASTRSGRPSREQEEPNEPPIDADTQTQIQAWLSGSTDQRKELLDAVHELDIYELGLVYQSAQKEEAKKTSVAVLALMMLREQRIEAIAAKWVEDDERMQRMQERLGTRGTGMQDTQSGMGRTRRR